MAERREPSHPPSDPHPGLSRASAESLLGGEDRPVRAQLVGALLLGLVLVASGLWLWRRPKAVDASTPSAADPASGAAAMVAGDGGLAPVVVLSAEAGASGPVILSEARILSCHDKGSKKTAPDQCDHVGAVEQALSGAITQSASCVPTEAGGGTIEYVADVSFSRHKLSVALPRAGRSVHDRKVLHACSTAVRGALQGVELQGVDHQHSRYKIAVTATYRASTSGG
ncbi:MAG TPA: hypothetical protein VIF09_10980 [Polyangiaceae bacterium]